MNRGGRGACAAVPPGFSGPVGRVSRQTEVMGFRHPRRYTCANGVVSVRNCSRQVLELPNGIMLIECYRDRIELLTEPSETPAVRAEVSAGLLRRVLPVRVPGGCSATAGGLAVHKAGA